MISDATFFQTEFQFHNFKFPDLGTDLFLSMFERRIYALENAIKGRDRNADSLDRLKKIDDEKERERKRVFFI